MLAQRVPRSVWLLMGLIAVIPDADVIGYRLGVAYGDLLGHRGLTHSLPFAALLSYVLAILLSGRLQGIMTRRRVWLVLFLAVASHGVLDALTNGGLGIAFLSPLTNDRYFFPFRPLEVSPLSVTRFLTDRGIAVLINEIAWVWLPAITLILTAWLLRAPHRDKPKDQESNAL